MRTIPGFYARFPTEQMKFKNLRVQWRRTMNFTQNFPQVFLKCNNLTNQFSEIKTCFFTNKIINDKPSLANKVVNLLFSFEVIYFKLNILVALRLKNKTRKN